MKTTLICSILLNVLLLAAAAFFVVAGEHTAKLPPATDSAAGKLPAQAAVSPALATTVELPFHWKQLDPGNDYGLFIANLRAIGCPEASIADIVQGNVDRAFSWERSKLRLDGSGSGPWSLARETALINNLLGNPDAPRAALYSQNAGAHAAEPLQGAHDQVAEAGDTLQGGNTQVAQVSDPQLYQNAQTAQTSSSWIGRGGTWNATAGLTPTASADQSSGGQGQQSGANANGNSQQNSGSEPQLVGGPTSFPYAGSSSDSSSSPGQPSAETSADGQPSSDDPFTKSGQDIMAQQQAEYYNWYEPQVEADTASDSPLVIDPDDFHATQ